MKLLIRGFSVFRKGIRLFIDEDASGVMLPML